MIYKKEFINLGKDSEQWFLSPRAAEAYPFSSVLFKEGGYSLLSSDFFIERPSAKGYSTMIISLKGEGRFIMEDGEEFILREGEIFISSPGSQGHREESCTEGRWEQIWLTFYGTSSILPSEEFDWKVLQAGEASLMRELMLSIIREDIHSTPESTLSLELSERLLLLTLRKLLQTSESEERARIRSSFEKIWNEVSSSLDQEWEVGRLCSMMNFSRSQLTRLCKEMYGEAPGEKIRRMRMESAKLLLSNSSMTIMEIADAVGYTSPSLFSSSFSAYSGMSPREYRKRRRDLRYGTSASPDQGSGDRTRQ